MLVELNKSGFKVFDTFDNVDKYQCSMSYHFHLKSGTKSKLINHQLTPILLTDEGKIWIGMCVVSLSSHKTVGHVELRGSAEIITHDRSLLERILSPIYKLFDQSIR